MDKGKPGRCPAINIVPTRNFTLAYPRRLTEALLAHDFNLRIRLSEGRLCSPVCYSPLTKAYPFLRVSDRLNYILWIQDLFDSTFSSLSIGAGVVEVVGVDM